MKKYYFLFLFFLIRINLLAQYFGGIQSSTKAHTLVEINSPNKGLLLPNLDTSAILGSPKSGLLIYSPQLAQPLFRQNNLWKRFHTSLDHIIRGTSSASILNLRNTSSIAGEVSPLELSLKTAYSATYSINQHYYQFRLGKNENQFAGISFIQTPLVENEYSGLIFSFNNTGIIHFFQNGNSGSEQDALMSPNGNLGYGISTNFRIPSGFQYTEDGRPTNDDPNAVKDGYVLTSDAEGNATWAPPPTLGTPAYNEIENIIQLSFGNVGTNQGLNNVYKKQFAVETLDLNNEADFYRNELLLENGIILNPNYDSTLTFTKTRYNIQFGLEFGNPDDQTALAYNGPVNIQLIPVDNSLPRGKTIEYSEFVKMSNSGTTFHSKFFEFLPYYYDETVDGVSVRRDVKYKVVMSVPYFGNGTQSLKLNRLSLKIINIY